MIRKGIIEKIHAAASMQRWIDHIRPLEFSELDKQAHKMIIAYVLARFEETERGPNSVDWHGLIEGGLFELLQRVVLTDIKPQIFQRIKSRHEAVLNALVLARLSDALEGTAGLRQRCEQYLTDPSSHRLERRILGAAHHLATRWEFQIIYELNRNLHGIEITKTRIANEMEAYSDLAGVQQVLLHRRFGGFIDLCGQLRFQQRWAQTYRVPKTSVLGHMLIVALLAYLCSLEITRCPKRLYNNFFAALFHDLPEVLTRDIISPVKRSIEGLEDTIEEIEQELLREDILPLLPEGWREEILYFTEDPFENRVLSDGEIRKGLSTEEISLRHDQEAYSPLDGRLIFLCDKLAAYLEAALSISHGMESAALKTAKEELRRLHGHETVGGFPFGQLFEYDYAV